MNEVILPDSPQRNPYGPLTPTQMFERTFELLRESPGLFFGIALLVIAVEVIFAILVGGGGSLLGHNATASASIAKALFVAPLALLGAVVIYVFAQIVQGALFLATRARLTRAPMTVGDACQAAAVHIGRLVGISLLIGVRVFAYMLLIFIPVGILMGIMAAVAHVPMSFQAGFASRVGIFSMLLIFLMVFVVAMLWLAIRYALAIPACLEENLRVTDAIRRSISLSRGSKGRLLALFLAVGVAWIAILALVTPLQLVAKHAGTGQGAGLSLAAAAIRIFFSWVLITFTGVATTLCYFDLRVRKDGFGAAAVVPVLQPPPIVPTATPDWPIEDLPIS